MPLQRLLSDIAEGLVDVVVVYKIDRLTRSLADFARIVEIFEKVDTSFVSVTQSFNTTGSMGKLMLNVLLSFAQFEREVTGERIRDKIAASKAKGLWMGGNLPLGYDLPANGSRALQVNPQEAERVRSMFERYLDLGSVHALQRQLADEGTLSKRWIASTGKVMGGRPFSRGALFHLLRNPVYIGKIRHGDQLHEGEHDAVVDPDLFAKVQDKLDANARRHKAGKHRRAASALLTGKLFDAAGEVMSPTVSRGRNGRVYRYYVSASLQQGATRNDEGMVQRLPAPAIDRLVTNTLARWFPKDDDPSARLKAIHLVRDGMQIILAGDQVASVTPYLDDKEAILRATKAATIVQLAAALPFRGGRRLIVSGSSANPQPDATLINALRRAHAMVRYERRNPVVDRAPASPYERRLLRLAFLAPDIQRDILTGHQPATLNLEKIMKLDLAASWPEQRNMLGWQSRKRSCSGE